MLVVAGTLHFALTTSTMTGGAAFLLGETHFLFFAQSLISHELIHGERNYLDFRIELLCGL